MTEKEVGMRVDGDTRELAISLDELHAHPMNANVMDEEALAKLAGHIKRTRRYPPVIVRAMPAGAEGDPGYQIIDGHHRVLALRRVGAAAARCLIWDVDDHETMMLLATLNRLHGEDDQKKRAALIAGLAGHAGLAALAKQLPESLEHLKLLAARTTPPPPPRTPVPVSRLPVAVHFFLTREQKKKLDGCLASLPGSREEALMLLVDKKGVRS